MASLESPPGSKSSQSCAKIDLESYGSPEVSFDYLKIKTSNVDFRVELRALWVRGNFDLNSPLPLPSFPLTASFL